MRRSIGLIVLLTLLALAAPARADHHDMHVVMCRDVRDGDPVGTVAVFTGTDPQTCVHVTLVEVSRPHLIRVEVSRPNGTIYRTMQTRTREASPGKYYPKYRVWWCLSIAKREPSYTLGQWGVRVLIDGQLVATTGFQVLGLGAAQVEKAQARLHALQGKVEANPADVEARLDLADALIDLDQLDEATVQLQKAVDQDPDLVQAHTQLGFVQYRQQRWDDAERSFLHVLRLRDDSAWTHFFLARVYVEKGDKTKAIEHFRKTVQLAGDTTLGKDAVDELAQLGVVL